MVREKEGRHFPRFGVVPPSVENVLQCFLAG
jgi:hypothetical protein